MSGAYGEKRAALRFLLRTARRSVSSDLVGDDGTGNMRLEAVFGVGMLRLEEEDETDEKEAVARWPLK